MTGFPFRDGTGPSPDSYWEVGAWIMVFLAAVFTSFFTGIDSQAYYIATAPQDYFLVASSDTGDQVYFTQDQVELLNTVNDRSLGLDAVSSERLYCGEIRGDTVRNFRLADTIKSSSLTRVAASCKPPVDIWLHSQPGFSSDLSDEDKSLESTGASYTCIQYAEATASPITGKVSGINCWNIVNNGEKFEEVPVFMVKTL